MIPCFLDDKDNVTEWFGKGIG